MLAHEGEEDALQCGDVGHVDGIGLGHELDCKYGVVDRRDVAFGAFGHPARGLAEEGRALSSRVGASAAVGQPGEEPGGRQGHHAQRGGDGQPKRRLAARGHGGRR